MINISPRLKTGEGTDDRIKIEEITQSINHELTQQQKLVVMVRLMELIIADEKITERESELLFLIGKNFKFDDDTVEAIKQFVVTKDPYGYSNSYSVVVSGAEEPEAL